MIKIHNIFVSRDYFSVNYLSPEIPNCYSPIWGEKWLTCRSLSMVRMFSTARTLRKYFSRAASLSADWSSSVLAASLASTSRSSGPWMSCGHRKTLSFGLFLRFCVCVVLARRRVFCYSLLGYWKRSQKWRRSRGCCCGETSSSAGSGRNPDARQSCTIGGRAVGNVRLWLPTTDLLASDADTDALPEDELHVGGVAQPQRRFNRQVHPLVSCRHPTQLGAIVDRWVPGCLHPQLNTWKTWRLVRVYVFLLLFFFLYIAPFTRKLSKRGRNPEAEPSVKHSGLEKLPFNRKKPWAGQGGAILLKAG